MKAYHLLLKLFFIMMIISSFGHSYIVKLAVYKDYDGLKHFISKLEDKKDKEEIIIHEKNGLYYAISRTFKNKHEARSALLRYKKVFLDAYITQDTIVKTPSKTIHKKPVNNDVLQNVVPQNNALKNDVLEKYLLKEINGKEATYRFMNFDNVLSKSFKVYSPEKLSLSWTDQLKLHKGVFYVRYMEGSKREKEQLMKFFFNKGILVFANLLDKQPTITRLYFNTQKRNMIVYSQDKRLSMKQYLEKVNDKYLLVKMYMNGQKANEARYYFNRSDALVNNK